MNLTQRTKTATTRFYSCKGSQQINPTTKKNLTIEVPIENADQEYQREVLARSTELNPR